MPGRPRPEYVHIADDLRSRIDSGRLRPGDKLPARPELAKEFGVATATVDRAVEELVREGVLIAWQRGTFVRDKPILDDGPSPEYVAIIQQLQIVRENLRLLATRVSRLEELARQAEERNM